MRYYIRMCLEGLPLHLWSDRSLLRSSAGPVRFTLWRNHPGGVNPRWSLSSWRGRQILSPFRCGYGSRCLTQTAAAMPPPGSSSIGCGPRSHNVVWFTRSSFMSCRWKIQGGLTGRQAVVLPFPFQSRCSGRGSRGGAGAGAQRARS
jgi:hypothetical protein